MLRRSLAAVVVSFALASLVLAGNYTGNATGKGVEDMKITIKVYKDKKDKVGEDKTLTVTKDTKYQQKGEKKKDAPKDSDLEGFNKAAKESTAKKGLPVTITTEGEGDKEVVTKIVYGGGKKGK